MPGTFIKSPKIDAANIASHLPEPLQWPGGALLQTLLDQFGADDPAAQIMGPSTTAVNMPELRTILSGFTSQSFKNPVLQRLYDRAHVGSPTAAAIASGVREPSTIVSRMRTPASTNWTLRTNAVPSEMRSASQELYRHTQDVLKALGIEHDEPVDLFRSGSLPKAPYLLTPTHIDPKVIEHWNADDTTKFKVPREKIRALVGLLHRGDDVTRGEALVPAHHLIQSATPLERQLLARRNPSMLMPGDFKRIPSWYKREVLK